MNDIISIIKKGPYKKGIIAIILICIIISFIGIAGIMFHDKCNETWIAKSCLWVSICEVLVAIANAGLLYATLKTQSKAINQESEDRKKDAFERTFYAMLETHRKITNEITAYDEVLVDNKSVKNTIHGRNFFFFTKGQLESIGHSLKSNHYLGLYKS